MTVVADPEVVEGPPPPSRAARRAGYLLLVPGLFIVALAVTFALAQPGADEFGGIAQALAPYVAVFGLAPLLVGLAILRRHRVAQVLGVVVGGLYGAFFIQGGLSGSPIAFLFGLVFVLAALLLVSALRSGER